MVKVKRMNQKPRIVVLDGYTLVPATGEGEPTWDALKALGDVTIYDRSAASEVVARAKDADIVIINKTGLPGDLLMQLPNVKYVGVLATGYNVVDVEAANRQGIVVCNVPDYSTYSVAQHVFALLLELASAVAKHDAAVARGEWIKCPDFCFTVQPLVELAGRKLGVIGMGSIGKQVARIGHAFGMEILAANQRSKDSVKLDGIPITWLDHDALFATADVITLHCPLTAQTQGLVNAERLSKMKSSAYVINTGRGPLIDEAALADALAKKKIAGAGLDVLSQEPQNPNSPLRPGPNCVITPHVAWASQAARRRCMQIATENVAAYLAGKPRNVVNKPQVVES